MKLPTTEDSIIQAVNKNLPLKERPAPPRTTTVEEAITTRIRQREQATAAPQPADEPTPVAPTTPAPLPATAPGHRATPPQARSVPWQPPQQLRLF